jgi:hypothetical protein
LVPHCGAVSPFFCGKTAGQGIFARHVSVQKLIKKQKLPAWKFLTPQASCLPYSVNKS